MLTGIFLGLAAAVAQSFSYLFSRHFISRHGSSFSLLVSAHIIMGIMALAVLPFVLHLKFPPINFYLPPLLKCAFFYLAGQLSFFLALKNADASRISPLLGLKIIIIAGISCIFFGNDFSAVQWIAVVVCLAGAVMTNWSGGTLPVKALVFLLLACIGYSLSDLYIKLLIDALGAGPLSQRSLLAASLCYVTCGIATMAAYPFMPGKSLKSLSNALPFAFCWFLAMLLLFGCFGFIGPVFGNIVQSTRGIFSIFIGILAIRLGYVHLETRTSGGVVARRTIAAGLMIAALLLFSFSRQISGFFQLGI